MIQLDPRDRLLIIGKTGTGKSYWTKKFLANELRGGRRIVVFDPCDEYSVHGVQSEHVDLGPLQSRVTMAELSLDPPRYLDGDTLSLSVVPGEDEQEPEAVAEAFCDLAPILKHTGDLLFVVEEVGYFEEHARPRIKEVATLYRKNGIAACFVAQRATQIPLTARSQASQVVSFRQDNADDLAALAKDFTDSFAERVSRLPPRKFEHWRDTTTQKEAQP